MKVINCFNKINQENQAYMAPVETWEFDTLLSLEL